jgi:hypothetical protein
LFGDSACCYGGRKYRTGHGSTCAQLISAGQREVKTGDSLSNSEPAEAIRHYMTGIDQIKRGGGYQLPIMDRALQVYEAGRPLVQNESDLNRLSTSLDGLAEGYRSFGFNDQAERAYRDAILCEESIKVPNRELHGVLLMHLSDFYVHIGKLKKAEPPIQDSVTVLNAIGSDQEAGALRVYQQILKKTDRTREADMLERRISLLVDANQKKLLGNRLERDKDLKPLK